MGVGNHSRNDRMIRSLPRCNNIRMSLREMEIRTPILQHESGAFGHDRGAETLEDGVDEGDAVSVFVGDCEVDGVTVSMCWAASVVDF